MQFEEGAEGLAGIAISERSVSGSRSTHNVKGNQMGRDLPFPIGQLICNNDLQNEFTRLDLGAQIERPR